MAAGNALLKPAHPGSILIFIEGGLLAWMASQQVWDSTNPTIGIMAGAAAFYAYSILYMIPYLNQILSIAISFPWAYAAGWVVEEQFSNNHVDIWLARVGAFLISAIAHWALSDSPDE
ncbi:MAG TPA: hypothetical protein VKQ54_11205 [Caulobacteraceae bacterium]|nr:hypothetical protein [Caulobacteraceae bacterium]